MRNKKMLFFTGFVGFILTIIISASVTWFSFIHQTKNELTMLARESLYTTKGYLSEARAFLDNTLRRSPPDCSLKSREVFIPELLSAVIVTDILYTLPNKTVCSLTYGDAISTALPVYPLAAWKGMQFYILEDSELAAGNGNILAGENGVFALLPYQQLARFYFISEVLHPRLRITMNNTMLLQTAGTHNQDELLLTVSKNSDDGLLIEYSISYRALYTYWLETFWLTQWAVNVLVFLLFLILLRMYIRHQLAMKTAIRHALKNGEFKLYYQPVVEIKTGKIQSLEALIRWPLKSGEAVPADVFIDVAEETGLIRAVTRYVLCEVLSNLKLLLEKHPVLSIAVNISADDLKDPYFAVSLMTQCQSYYIAPQHLKLEITERSLVQDEIAKYNMKVLSEEGFIIILDDFGTGYSSLSYLNKLPVQALKIDQSFIQGFGMNIATGSVVPQIVSMAQHLKMDVIAEGVETHVQVKALSELHVQYAQGWFYDKAMSFDEIRDKLADNDIEPYTH